MKTDSQRFQFIKLGHAPAVRLAAYYALFFGLLCAALFWMANLALTQTIQRKQLKAVTNKALEYRAWYLKGDIQQLEKRMGEQTLQAGDTLFVHIVGDDYNYINFSNNAAIDLPHKDVRRLEKSATGNNIKMGGLNWTVHSIPIEGTNLVLQAGKHSQALENTLDDFWKTSLWILLPGGLIAITGGVFLAYRFLAPTRQLIQTMRGILASGDLSQRANTHHKGNELNSMVELFNRLLGENERLINVMEESLDHIAHDLRSPLSRMRITAERALTNKKTSNEQNIRNALSDCAEEIDYVQRLLTVLMNVAEAKSGTMVINKEIINASKLIQDIFDLYELVAEDKQITLSVDCPDALTFQGDRTRLAQALANLVDNAIKYSPANSEITIQCKLDDDQVVISVSDHGIGIKEEDIPLIWNRLFRADKSRSQRGMGLGLSLVKAIAVAHRGDVQVVSNLTKGSTFTISIPA